MSRQVDWQKKQKTQGRCIICGKPAIPKNSRCVICWLKEVFRRWKKNENESVYTNIKTVEELQKLVDKTAVDKQK